MFEWIITMFESTWLRGIRTRAITPEDYPLDVGDVTRWAIEQYNNSTPNEFFKRFACSKATYLRRIKWYGDPYMNSPLAKMGKKFLLR